MYLSDIIKQRSQWCRSVARKGYAKGKIPENSVSII